MKILVFHVGSCFLDAGEHQQGRFWVVVCATADRAGLIKVASMRRWQQYRNVCSPMRHIANTEIESHDSFYPFTVSSGSGSVTMMEHQGLNMAIFLDNFFRVASSGARAIDATV